MESTTKMTNQKNLSKTVDITFFVPCLNEENNIRPTLHTLLEAMSFFPGKSFEIMAFDDGSTDRTHETLKEFNQSKPELSIRIFHNAQRMGLGFNYFRGSQTAAGKYYMLVNGDNDMPVDLICKMIRNIGNAEILVPYLGRADSRPLSRRVISWIFTKIVNIVSGTRLKYYNGPVVHLTENVRTARILNVGFAYQAELLCDLIRQGKSYEEIQVTVEPKRNFGKTKAFSFQNFSLVAKTILILLKKRKTSSQGNLPFSQTLTHNFSPSSNSVNENAGKN